MVRMPPVHDANGSRELGSKVVQVINETTSEDATVKRIEFVGPSVGADWRRPVRWRCWWR